jgi:hypothetical protein
MTWARLVVPLLADRLYQALASRVTQPAPVGPPIPSPVSLDRTPSRTPRYAPSSRAMRSMTAPGLGLVTGITSTAAG